MTHKKSIRRVISLILICTMFLTLSIPASAETLQDANSSSNASPRAFVRECEVYLMTDRYTQVTSDSNWWGETTVTVAVVSSIGDYGVFVYVKDSLGNTTPVKSCSKNGRAAAFSIPAGSFTVYAKYSAPSPNYVTLSVSLA